MSLWAVRIAVCIWRANLHGGIEHFKMKQMRIVYYVGNRNQTFIRKMNKKNFFFTFHIC